VRLSGTQRGLQGPVCALVAAACASPQRSPSGGAEEGICWTRLRGPRKRQHAGLPAAQQRRWCQDDETAAATAQMWSGAEGATPRGGWRDGEPITQTRQPSHVGWAWGACVFDLQAAPAGGWPRQKAVQVGLVEGAPKAGAAKTSQHELIVRGARELGRYSQQVCWIGGPREGPSPLQGWGERGLGGAGTARESGLGAARRSWQPGPKLWGAAGATAPYRSARSLAWIKRPAQSRQPVGNAACRQYESGWVCLVRGGLTSSVGAGAFIPLSFSAR
jgi:hypothetical protein